MIQIETQEAPAPPQQGDKRVRHYVERLSPKGEEPAVFSATALCGADVSEIFVEHNREICQGCVDESRRRPVEK